MERKERIDAFGAVSLTIFSLILALNQVVIAVVNEGIQPVFFAGLRSFGALFCMLLWFGFRRRALGIRKEDLLPGLAIGALFATEFVFLFIALDLTTVTRVSVIFYTMPLWLALMAHVFIPGERLTPIRVAGLLAAFTGVTIAIVWRGNDAANGGASFAGDILALLAAISWAGIAFVARTGLSHVAPDRQLIWQLAVSAVLLLAVAPLFGPLIRDFVPIHLAGVAFQIVIVASFGYAFWLWLLSIYPASGVAAFSFLAPGFGVALGSLLLGEPVGLPILVALALVCLGLVLINRPRQVPQKV